MSGHDFDFVRPEQPEDGAALLDDVRTFLGRFVAYPSAAALDAVTLWAAHTHVVHSGENTPRLALLSPEPWSGKTRTLEALEVLVPRPMRVENASPATVFRSIASEQPTILFDEVDAIFTRRGTEDPNEELRGVLNAGHRKGSTVPRCVGPSHEVKRFDVFCAVALAGLGDLPDTLMSRAVVVRMRRRAPSEPVEAFRPRLHRGEGHALRDRLTAWLEPLADHIGAAWPQLPEGITDRPADVWEPLLAVAEAAGGEWTKRARQACAELCQAAQSTDSGSLGIRLLTDLRAVFGDAAGLATETILRELRAIEDAPWDDLRGKPLDARGLARRLKPYGVASTKLKIGADSVRGYRREDLWDAWQRYLPASSPAEPELPELVEPPRSDGVDQVPDAETVPEPRSQPEPTAPAVTSTVPQVPEVPLLREAGRNPNLNGDGVTECTIAHAEDEYGPCRGGCGAIVLRHGRNRVRVGYCRACCPDTYTERKAT